MNHYQRLGVSRAATSAQLRVAYRARVRLVHPDASHGTDAEMAALNEAWRILSDPASRARYDESLRPPSTTLGAHDQFVGSLKLAAIAAVVMLVLLAFIAMTQSG